MALRSELFFDLPDDLIAKEPLESRDQSKLLVIDRKTGRFYDQKFFQILDYFSPPDLLLVNHSRIIKARLRVVTQRGVPLELFFLQALNLEGTLGLFMVKPGKRAKIGTEIHLKSGEKGRVVELTLDGHRKIHFERDILEILEEQGEIPVPPYVKGGAFESDQYRTLFEKNGKSLAAPTAGLHFSLDLIEKIKKKISWLECRLDVGLGTFLPIKENNIENHKMHKEFYLLEPQVFHQVKEVKKKGGKVFCCGTTSVRALESIPLIVPGQETLRGETNLFIKPGFPFSYTDALITNFHLPYSTLLLLVRAFGGTELIKEAYSHAIKNHYRFYSFGDAMLIL